MSAGHENVTGPDFPLPPRHVSWREAFRHSRARAAVRGPFSGRGAAAGGAETVTEIAVSGSASAGLGSLVATLVSLVWVPARTIWRALRSMPAARDALYAEQVRPLRQELETLKSRAEWWHRCRVPSHPPLPDPATVERCGRLVRSHHASFMALAGMARSLVLKLADRLEEDRNAPQALLWKYISRSSSDLGVAQEHMVAFVHRGSRDDPRQVLVAAWLTYRRVLQWIHCLAPRMPGTADSEEFRRWQDADDRFRDSMIAKMDELEISWMKNTLSQADDEAPC